MKAKRRRQRSAPVIPVLLGVAVLTTIPRALIWYYYERPVTWAAWSVPVAGSGSVEYRVQGPLRRAFGATEQERVLVWRAPDAPARRYPISGIGGADEEVEVRLLDEGRGLWLVNPLRARILATLDLASGEFTDSSGTLYDQHGEPSAAPEPRATWATVTGGKVIARARLVSGPRGLAYRKD
jgi:hypothetical protein